MNQPIVSGILKQPSRYKTAESNFLADDKGSQLVDHGSCLVIHLLFIFFRLTRTSC